MASIGYPLTNGVRHEWSSCEFKFNGRIFVGVRSVNYDVELKPSLVYGTAPQPIGMTRGVLTPTGDFEMLQAELDQLLTALGDGYGEKYFQGLVSYSEPWYDTMQDELVGCRITKIGAALSQGADAIYRKVEMMMLDVKLNGRSITSVAVGGAATAA